MKQWLARRLARRRHLHRLREEHERINLLGFQANANIPVRTLDVFVALQLAEYHHRLGEEWQAPMGAHTQTGANKQKRRSHRTPQPPEAAAQSKRFSPGELLQYAFFSENPGRLLLILGDPGSGKTTLMKYYAMSCLDRAGRRTLGLPRRLLPVFVPLRLLKDIDEKQPFCSVLSEKVCSPNKPVPPESFERWLDRPGCLVLLDGLDEISEVKQRIRVCRWIEQACTDYRASFFIITSRYTGYRVSDGVELRRDHVRADVLALNGEQQQVFLQKWFRAVYSSAAGNGADRAGQAQKVAAAVRDYLGRKENASLRQLAGTPVLLQIMAVLWQEYGSLEEGRANLYEKCTDYLLDRRDRLRDLPPPLPADRAKIVLRPLALFMQEMLRSPAIPAAEMAERMTRPLQEVKPGLTPEDFVTHLCDRAGLLKAYGDGPYVFSHGSFREFLAATELAEQITRNPGRCRVLVDNFNAPDGWWRETILFSLSLSKPVIFNDFFQLFLPHPKNGEGFPELLELIIKEARQKSVDPFERFLCDPRQDWQKRYNALMCLRLIASDPARKLVKQVWKQLQTQAVPAQPKQAEGLLRLRQKAEEILIEWKLVRPAALAARDAPVAVGAKSFRNPFELQAEYILIPGGKYKYFVTKKEVEVPPLYFAKYPVTNRLYRRFIAYLDDEKSMAEVLAVLPLKQFGNRLWAQAAEIKGLREYLGSDASRWAANLQSSLDDDKRFNGDDQPVVGVTWFAAWAYCYWLSELQGAGSKGQDEKMIYRLPTEQEWEWPAGGGKREYPWGNEEPNDTRANYDEKVGKTTPVGSYPAGATPEGLMDMAGNVWEWMENWYDKDEDWRALRGGSWRDSTVNLRCAARNGVNPDGNWDSVGFRVVAVQSSFDTLKL
ncbi:MAG: SUMF1/EgtB/PvdO family nonheme iron enzyme [candidate division KSB1 bacterium]|nr:SUMF1/EgtB/PvdO family nonheme iron enzyme [candidate division KSB1 bacterium]MDZ7274392.1 SUMF1/EgtB/PvdO family nonheme iron enzyme [candidate division KSB1 bacterium]MDZ7284946.1 SUMF1/EgtB/PvdO family nonheme iron enzyme [candidate division KSB1 bacterium]MDZ7297633.1 SUMF1/EgtB/PvdO family nonheme iron enzyme [candidate division KSB1 bacterium]MDZ7306373.1 SUMF1/EgtB/PvdO family nonheme iron enzyme [candidate division KSB1 bacterium]